MHDHRLEFGTHEHTSTSAQQQHNHKFELESVGLVLGAPAGAAPSEVQQLVARGDELEHLSQAGGGADKQAGIAPESPDSRRWRLDSVAPGAIAPLG